MFTYGLLIIGFIILVKGADFLVDGASSLAAKLKIAPIVIGLTIVAFGTSMPELVVNIFASISGNSEIAIGNIVGSNIANILLILGLAALVFPLVAKKNTAWKEIPLCLLSAVLVSLMANNYFIKGNYFLGLSRIDGLVLLLFFGFFVYYVVQLAKQPGSSSEPSIKTMSTRQSVILTILGLAGLALGGHWIVKGAVQLATQWGVSQSIIGLTIVAIGTSLPELATSVMAAYKKQADIAIGNVVGSNIFNTFWILGVSSLIRPLPFSSANNTDLLVMIGATIVLFLVMIIGKKRTIERWQGGIMIGAYIAYVIFLVSSL